MENLSFGFTINDEMSSGLKSITGALAGIVNYLEDVDKSIEGVDKKNFDTLKKNVSQACSSIDQLGQGFTEAGREAQGFNNTNLNKINKSAGQVSQSIAGIGNEAKSSFNSLENQIGDVIRDFNRLDNSDLSGLINESKKASSKIDEIGESAKKSATELEKIREIDLDNGSAENLTDAFSSLTDALNLSNFMNISEIVGDMTDRMGDFVASAVDAAEVMGNFSNQFEIGLNLPQADLQVIQDETTQAYLNNYGDSLDELAEKAIYAKQLLGDKVDNSDISELLAQMTTLEGANMDYEETLRGINNMSNAFGTTWQHNADLMTAGMQAGLNMSDEFGDNMAEYAPLFKDFGFTGEEFLALGKLGIDSGAYNLDKVYDFLKEFQITLKDGKMEENIMRFGDATEDAFWRMQDGSASAKDVFDAMVSDLNNMPDLKRGTLLSDTFSALGEDNADAVILAMKDYEQVAQDVFGNVSGAAQAAADANGTAAGQLKRWWEAMPMVLAPIGEGIATVIVKPIEGIKNLGSLISNLWNGSITFGDLTEQGKQSIDTYINGMMGSMPNIIKQGWQTITDFITGIQDKVPDLALGAVDMIISLANYIGDNFPTLMQKAGETILAFSQGLRENLPIIIGNGIEAVGNLISGLWQRLPQIIEAGANLIGGLIKGIVTMIPLMIQNGINLIMALLNTIWQNIPTLINTGLQIVSSIVSGIAQGFGMLIFKAFELIIQFVQSIVNAVSQTYSTVVQAGRDLIQGFLDGLNGGFSAIGTWLNDSFNWIIDTVKNILGIHSPSDVFIGIGGDLIQGFFNGITSIWGQVSDWFNNTFKGLIDTAKGWISNFFGGGNDTPQIDFSQSEEELNRLKETVQTTFNQINAQTAQITAMCKTVIDQFTGMVNTTLGLLNNLEITAVSVISRMCQSLISLSSTFSSMIKTIWQTIQTAITTIVASMAQTVINTIKNMGDSILTIMRKLPGQMKQIGSGMMGSLKNGIESQKSAVTNTASTIVQSLKSTFEAGLGIHSPSDYMIWVGQMMLAGLLQGMSGDQVQKFIGTMISDMQSSFEAGKFNANELVNFLSDDAVMNIIGKVGSVDTSKMSDQTITYPLSGGPYDITSLYGYRIHPIFGEGRGHGGIDIGAPQGTPILSALAGTVSVAGQYGGYGNAVVVNTGDMKILYGHMSSIGAQVGQQVQKGQQIGLVGSTGWSTGPHLHFEFRHMDDSTFDPFDALMGATVSTGGNPLQTAIQNAYNTKHGIVSTSTNLGGNVAYSPSAGVAQWTPQVKQALQMLGQPESLLNDVLYAIDKESTGNPNSINDWDSNSGSDPSRGLLQTIGATFNAYRNPSLSNNIYDPLANIYAGLSYMIQTYGGIHEVVEPRRNSVNGWYGYEVGTRYVPADMFAMLHEGEAVIPAGQNPYSQSGGNYLADLVDSVLSVNTISQATNTGYTDSLFDLEPTLSTEPERTSTGGTTTNNFSISLNVNQYVTDQTDARKLADDTLNILYEEIERQYSSQGGGVSIAY